MRPVSFEVPSHSTVELPEISSAFADMVSDQQAIILMDFFDALEHKCKDAHYYEKQLHWISVEIKRNNFKRLKYTFETIAEFLKEDE